MRIKKENIFKHYLEVISVLVIVLFVSIFITLFYKSISSMRQFGLTFYTSAEWNPCFDEYGSLAFLVGTLITSGLALIISIPFSLMISIFLGEYFRGGVISNILKIMVELLAGIPSIVYGLWGLFVFVPFFRNLQQFLFEKGILSDPPIGIGIFTASVILAVMIIPYSASISRDVIALVPLDLKEAGYSMGGTRMEVISQIVLPYSKSGIFAGTILALGRALGETMAVTMVIGNRNFMPKGIFDPASTLASVLGSEFAESSSSIHLSSLVHLGLVLFLTTGIINILGKAIIGK